MKAVFLARRWGAIGLALIALAVRLTSPGPIIFAQDRVGLRFAGRRPRDMPGSEPGLGVIHPHVHAKVMSADSREPATADQS